MPAADCAAAIVQAIEGDGFEFYAPPDMPGGFGSQHDIVVGKTQDPDAFLSMVAGMAKDVKS